ncbi:M56 family metallopeptidase [Caulobacter sp. DWR1-3-2b1]|uniref:M56 family metallopeptidase n=1 Tax=Caulobacter sp. DWR1-3-2b1 TaxID=2804670 RepID=UPI003CF9741B
MASDILALLLRANLAIAAAVLLVLVLRRPVRSMFGARAAYGLWLIAPLAVLAVLLPARVVSIAAPAPSTVASTPPTPKPTPTPTPTPRPAPIPMPGVETMAISSSANSHRLRNALAIGWALVALLAVGVQAERQRRFMKSLGRLRGEKDLFHAEHAGVGPAVIGALAPRVVLPADFALRFTPEEQALILAHERNHLSMGDAQINALTTAIQCLFWFNPLVHLGANRLRVDQEIACDAAVLTRYPVARRTYGEAMLKTQLAPHAPPLGCHWPASANSQLKERFVMLKQHRQGRARRVTGAASVAVLALGVGFAAWAAQPARTVQERPGVTKHDRARDIASPLYRAVLDGDIAKARELIVAGADVNFKAAGDGTPLIEAARSGRTDLVELLLASGADPSLAVRGDGAPLIAAANTGRLDIVKALVERGASIDMHVPGDDTPLITAIRAQDVATVGYLIDKGANVNRVAPGDGTPLIEAARSGRLDLVRLLLAKGADADLAVRGDGNPLITAASAGRLDMVRALVEHGASVESFVPGDETPLINAAQSGDLATVTYLVEKGADVNRAVPSNPGQTRSPLGEAVKRGHRAVADYLRAKGARA